MLSCIPGRWVLPLLILAVSLQPSMLVAETRDNIQGRPISIKDLVGLRDPTRLRMSPDGKWASYVVVHAVLETNDYLAELFIVPTDASRTPERLAVMSVSPGHGDLLAGQADSLWAPDSRRVAFVRERGGVFEVWCRDVTTGQEERLASGLANIVLNAWASDGDSLYYSVAFFQESASLPVGASGEVPDPAYRFGPHKTIIGRQAPRWQVVPHHAHLFVRFEVTTRTTTLLTAEEFRAHLPAEAPNIAFSAVEDAVVSQILAKVVSPDGRSIAFMARLRTPSGRTRPAQVNQTALYVLDTTAASKARRLWSGDKNVHALSYVSLAWTPDSAAVIVVKREQDVSQVYSVQRRDGLARLLFETPSGLSSDGLSHPSFDAAAQNLLTVAQRPDSPPVVVKIDLSSGLQTVLHRPNAGFDTLVLPKLRFMQVSTRYGHKFGIRVTLPNDYQHGRRYPLVATTYAARNIFQRGAAGDEYPIYPFAASGFVVISLDHTTAMLTTAATGEDGYQKSDVDLIRYRSMLEALESAVEQLSNEGLVDKSQCAITGLSYGSDVVAFALSHSTLFRVAELSAHGTDPIYYFFGANAQSQLNDRGFPRPDTEGLAAWEKLSPALNATKINMALLMQPPDIEAVINIQTYMALAERNVPVDMYVYPQEFHVKSWPWSRYRAYERNLDWIRFWLQDYEDPAPYKREQYQYWREMRAKWERTKRLQSRER